MNVMRWRYGDTNPIMVPIEHVTEVHIGDMLFEDAGLIWPADDFEDLPPGGFIGVAMQMSATGDNGPIRVATTGVFEFECEEDEYEIADHVSPAFLQSQVVQILVPATPEAVRDYSVGRVVRKMIGSTRRILVETKGKASK